MKDKKGDTAEIVSLEENALPTVILCPAYKAITEVLGEKIVPFVKEVGKCVHEIVLNQHVASEITLIRTVNAKKDM